MPLQATCSWLTRRSDGGLPAGHRGHGERTREEGGGAHLLHLLRGVQRGPDDLGGGEWPQAPAWSRGAGLQPRGWGGVRVSKQPEAGILTQGPSPHPPPPGPSPRPRSREKKKGGPRSSKRFKPHKSLRPEKIYLLFLAFYALFAEWRVLEVSKQPSERQD